MPSLLKITTSSTFQGSFLFLFACLIEVDATIEVDKNIRRDPPCRWHMLFSPPFFSKERDLLSAQHPFLCYSAFRRSYFSNFLWSSLRKSFFRESIGSFGAHSTDWMTITITITKTACGHLLIIPRGRGDKFPFLSYSSSGKDHERFFFFFFFPFSVDELLLAFSRW